jgi:murein DD-endopeptidase MepM/ murein hydrolase activator NlpD
MNAVGSNGIIGQEANWGDDSTHIYEDYLGMSSSDRSNYLTINLQFGGKNVAFSIPPVLIVLVLVFGAASYKVADMNALSAHQRQQKLIGELQTENDQLENVLAHKERERNQMVALAEARSEELWNELENRDREISRLWKVVGEKPAKTVVRGSKPRRALLGSRSGERHNALAVKVGYSHLENQIETREKEIEDLTAAAKKYRQKKVDAYKRELASRVPSISPCQGELTSDFGNRVHPVYGYGRFHGGCDFTTAHGTPINATAAGTVVHSDWLGGYGKVIEIDHGNGLKTLYAHCSELIVTEGSKVKKGQIIAKVGTTGLSSGPHCHYEVHQGKKQIDPKPYLKDLPGKTVAQAKTEATQ